MASRDGVSQSMAIINTIRSISQTYRHINRYRQIVNILLKNGFGYLFRDVRIYRPGNWSHLGAVPEQGSSRIRDTLAELGPTFIKLGQLFSCREDILPQGIINELKKLQDQVPPIPFEQVRQIIRNDLHADIGEIFQDFSRQPVGAASMAQGYRAVLKDGRKVFVKVRRPGIEKQMAVDLEILSYIVARVEHDVPQCRIFHLASMVETFADRLMREVDFHGEVANMEVFIRQHGRDDALVIPHPCKQYCTDNIIVMDFIDGIRGNDLDAIVRSGVDLQRLAENGIRLLLEQVFDYGFFHADPHPGNIFVMPGNRLCYVDFGSMGRITVRERQIMARGVAAMFSSDSHEMTRLVLELVELSDKPDMDSLECDLGALVDRHLRGNVAELCLVDFIGDFYSICRRYHLCLKPHFYEIVKAMGYAEAFGRQIAPQFNIYQQLRPFILRQTLRKFDLMSRIRQIFAGASDWEECLMGLPGMITPALQQLIDGRLKIRHEQEDVARLALQLRKSSQRLAWSILLSALLLAIAMVASAVIISK